MTDTAPETNNNASATPPVPGMEGKTARVQVIQDRTQIGNFIFNAGAVIESVSFADAEYFESKGKVTILGINP